MSLVLATIVLLLLAACDRGQVDTLTTERNELRTRVETAETRASQAEAERDRLAAHVQELEAEVAQREAAIAELEADVEERDARVAEREQQLEQVREERDELEAQLEQNIDAQLALLESELAGARASIQALEARREVLRAHEHAPADVGPSDGTAATERPATAADAIRALRGQERTDALPETPDASSNASSDALRTLRDVARDRERSAAPGVVPLEEAPASSD